MRILYKRGKSQLSNDSILKLSFYRSRDSQAPDRHRENIPNPFLFRFSGDAAEQRAPRTRVRTSVAKCAQLYIHVNSVTMVIEFPTSKPVGT